MLLAQIIRREEEYGSNWRSSSHHSKKDPSSDEEYEELNSWRTSRNDDFMNEEDDKLEWSRWILPTKQIKDKYSIAILFCYTFDYIQLMCYAW